MSPASMNRKLFTLFFLMGLSTTAHAYQFALDNFKVVQDGVTIFQDSFSGSTTLPAAPNFTDGTASVYLARGNFPAPVGGKLILTSAGTEISPVNPNRLVQRGLLERTASADNAINASAGLPPAIALKSRRSTI